MRARVAAGSRNNKEAAAQRGAAPFVITRRWPAACWSGRPVQPAAARQKVRVLVFTSREDRSAWRGGGRIIFVFVCIFSFPANKLLLLFWLSSLCRCVKTAPSRLCALLCLAPLAYLGLCDNQICGSVRPLFVCVCFSFGSCKSSPRRLPFCLLASEAFACCLP